MERHPFKSVTKKLILSLLSALFLIFCLLSASIYLSSRKYIHDNAFNHATNISSNILQTLNRRILGVEQIPQTINTFVGPYDRNKHQGLPSKILSSYPYLDECFIAFGSSGNSPLSLHAIRQQEGMITNHTGSAPVFTDDTHIFRKNAQGGCWSFLNYHEKECICYCVPLSGRHGTDAILGFIFRTNQFVDFASDIKLYNLGHLFFTDSKGKTIYSPLQTAPDNIHEYFTHSEHEECKKDFLKGKTGFTTVRRNNRKHFLFYTPVSHLNWRLSIICPYHEILITSNKFYGLLLIICSLSMLLLIIMTFIIARQITKPLKVFTGYARNIKNDRTDMRIMSIKSNDEFGELRDAFRYLQQNMNNYAEKLKISEKIQMEIRLAQKLQQRFLPRPLQLPENIEVKGELRQSKSVGGDLYEYFLINNLLYFAIGDVSGKGIPAALYMASVVKLFRYVASKQTSTAHICNTINTYMSDNADDDMYVTMIVGILNINTGEITFTNAGHPEPLVVHPDRQIEALRFYSDSPIGILENYSYREYRYTLEDNALLLLYTDGITDAEDKYSQFYGKDRLIENIRISRSLHPKEIIDAILEDLRKHTHDAELSDDFTLLSILFSGGYPKQPDGYKAI